MPRTDLNDIVAFLAVARERSFTRAAAQLGVSQSALSQTLRGLEARLGLRLPTRTTRSVAQTEAGERLLRAPGPRLGEIDAELAALIQLREKPAIRITAHDHAVETVLWPARLFLHAPSLSQSLLHPIGNGIIDSHRDADLTVSRACVRLSRRLVAICAGGYDAGAVVLAR